MVQPVTWVNRDSATTADADYEAWLAQETRQAARDPSGDLLQAAATPARAPSTLPLAPLEVGQESLARGSAPQITHTPTGRLHGSHSASPPRAVAKGDSRHYEASLQRLAFRSSNAPGANR